VGGWVGGLCVVCESSNKPFFAVANIFVHFPLSLGFRLFRALGFRLVHSSVDMPGLVFFFCNDRACIWRFRGQVSGFGHLTVSCIWRFRV
jgi:hypothetical protein